MVYIWHAAFVLMWLYGACDDIFLRMVLGLLRRDAPNLYKVIDQRMVSRAEKHLVLVRIIGTYMIDTTVANMCNSGSRIMQAEECQRSTHLVRAYRIDINLVEFVIRLSKGLQQHLVVKRLFALCYSSPHRLAYRLACHLPCGMATHAVTKNE